MMSTRTGQLKVEVRETLPLLCVRLRGELDLYTAPDLPAVTPESVWVFLLDVRQLSFCDSAGLQRLQALCTGYADAGVDVAIMGASPMLRKLAWLTGLLQGFSWKEAG